MSSFCGSPEYMSPEMLNKTGHTFSLDIYSLGVILYEFITGLPPHYSQDQAQMMESIMNSEENLALPSNISMTGRFLLSSLLIKLPENRLGSKGGIKEIKDHPWCQNCDWKMIMNKKSKPPYVPLLYDERWRYEGNESISRKIKQKLITDEIDDCMINNENDIKLKNDISQSIIYINGIEHKFPVSAIPKKIQTCTSYYPKTIDHSEMPQKEPALVIAKMETPFENSKELINQCEDLIEDTKKLMGNSSLRVIESIDKVRDEMKEGKQDGTVIIPRNVFIKYK